MSRPSKFKDEYCDQLSSHLSEGYSFKSFAGRIGVSEDTIHRWKNEFNNFKEAYEIGKSSSLFYWEDLGRELSKKNASVYMLNMRNRFDWDKEDSNTTKSITIHLDNDDIHL